MEAIEIKSFLESLKVEHKYCDDCWYSCPKDKDGCCNSKIPKDTCTCGADEHNKKIDDFIIRLKAVKISPEMPELFESKEPKV